MNVYVCILLMSAVTYAIRIIPMVLLRKKITNTFIVSFLYYAPYVTLSVMIFPAILYCTSDIRTAAVGLAVSFILSLCNAGLVGTAFVSCAAVYLAQLIF